MPPRGPAPAPPEQPRPAALPDDEARAHHAAANPALPVRTIELLATSGGHRHS